MKRYTYRMKTFQIQIFGTILIAVFVLLPVFAAAQFANGSGTEEDPYQVETLEQLQEIRNHTDKHFIQIADIDASETAEWDDGKGFDPLGGRFYYDGQGYVISDLTINRADRNSVGLFGHAGNSILKNIGLENADITGNRWVGGLVGDSNLSRIVNSWITGKETENRDVGGLAGKMGMGSFFC